MVADRVSLSKILLSVHQLTGARKGSLGAGGGEGTLVGSAGSTDQ